MKNVPFGMGMPGRQYNAGDYSFGFNGALADDEVKGNGNSLDFGARIYDSRLGRFFSLDPARSGWSFESQYAFAGNTPIQAIDMNGERIYFVNKDGTILDLSVTANINKIDDEDYRISLQTLLKTCSGAELFNMMNTTYDNHDVYFKRSKVHQYHDNTVASTLTLGSSEINNNVINIADPGEYNLDENYDHRMTFNGLKVRKSNNFSVVLPLGNFKIGIVAGWNEEKKVYETDTYNQYDLAETIYHEIYSHIWQSIKNPPSSTKYKNKNDRDYATFRYGYNQHKSYGSESAGLDLERVSMGIGKNQPTPYKNIVSELLQLQRFDQQSKGTKAPIPESHRNVRVLHEN